MLGPSDAWVEQSKCAGMPSRSFFPPDCDSEEDEASGDDGAEAALALRICQGGPVRVPCFKYSLRVVDLVENGVIGGTTPKDRRRYIEAVSLR